MKRPTKLEVEAALLGALVVLALAGYLAHLVGAAK